MYNFKNIENKWQDYWDKNHCFKTDIWDFSKPKYYVLDMFPYPSGIGLHAGHPEGYTATDIIARMKRMQGFNVLHPMGFDSFGLPAEQYAIQTGNNPSGFTKKNIDTFRGQLKNIGLSYDWDREISTAEPDFYKWTQWIFKQMVTDSIAKKIDMPVNWCPQLGTVLANDEVIDGKSERGGYPVIRRNMKQWVIDIPKYAERLLEGLEELDWPNSTKEAQKNWIGKSVGAHVNFNVFGMNETFTVFTTRCDTLFGATYCVLSPEHPLVDLITTDEMKEMVNEYKSICASKSDMERTELNKDKTGVFTGAYAINPVNGKNIPIWISDYVLVTYGTGAIMAVPAHDDRDYAFAKKYNIPIIQVLDGGDISEEAYVGDGVHINSGFLDGLNKEEAIKKMLEWLNSSGVGCLKVNYKIREWIFARQRYWGEPIPTVELDNGEMVVLRDEELPLILPTLDNYSPLSDGRAPLCRDNDWVNVEINGIKGKRETSTMPGSAGSSWYYLRYIDPTNDKFLADKKLLEHWLPVDLYVGGHEHVVGHLLYARMWNNYLYDKGIVPCKEPFKKLTHQGMILGENGIKMGKRYPEFAINPNDIIDEYGADTLRLYEMFMGPIEADKPWNTNGVNGAHKFLERVWRLIVESGNVKDTTNPNLDRSYNEMVKKVTEDYANLNFNTAISQLMIFINDCYKESVVPLEYAVGFIKLLYPVSPHICEEMYELLGNSGGLTYSSWPTYDESFIINDVIDIAVQVNGKVRGTISINDSMSEDEIKDLAINNSNVMNFTCNKEIIKIIVVKGKIVNIVVK